MAKVRGPKPQTHNLPTQKPLESNWEWRLEVSPRVARTCLISCVQHADCSRVVHP